MKRMEPPREDHRAVVIYARKSKITHKGDSIANQEEYCKEYARLHLQLPSDYEYQVYEDGASFTPGKAEVLREGKDGVIVASGIMVHEALQAAETLSADGIEMTVIDPITIKPLDVDTIRACAEKTGLVVVAENHNHIGGLTSAVQEAITGLPLKFGYVAIEDEFGEVGPLDYLRERFDLTCDHIVKVVKGLK